VALVRREIDRLDTLAGKLGGELERARASDAYRRQGEALLAGLSRAQVRDGTAYVADPYDATGATIAVPIDPALTLADNARVLFGRYKKGKRSVETIHTRLEAVRQRLLDWRALSGPAADTRVPADLDRLREAMARLGLVHAARPAKSPRPMRPKEEPTRVRRYTSPEGLAILVGKSGRENDTLTFRVASPCDFWLHAADRPGAHVIVRNPQRLKSLPERTLRMAADIAAYHSGARREARVDVHYTQRKHVHKKKGMPGGQVLLRRFRTIQATPRLPTSTIEEV
jgi:predicted ribosome quality control (RQC) complex YloA/Tae2 family protein